MLYKWNAPNMLAKILGSKKDKINAELTIGWVACSAGRVQTWGR
jgi:hypothetical protein